MKAHKRLSTGALSLIMLVLCIFSTVVPFAAESPDASNLILNPSFETDGYWSSGGALNHRMAFYSNSYIINPVQLKFDLGFDWRPSDSNEQNLISSNQDEWITYNVRTAMLGAMMVQNVSNRLNVNELSALKEGWNLYKENQRPILRGANVYHILPMPTGVDWDGIEYYNEELEIGSVFIFKDKAGPTEKTTKLKGLDVNGTYRLSFEDRTNLDCVKSGSELMTTGIHINGFSSAYDSEIIWIERPDEPEKPSPIYVLIGDVDFDEKINVKDATSVQKHCADLLTLSESALEAADADRNHDINVKDATAIQKFCASLPSDCPIGEKIMVSSDSKDPTEPENNPTETIPEPEEDSSLIYLHNAASWSNPCCYFWSDTAGEYAPWPGVPMQYIESGYYSFKVPPQYNKIIFSDSGSPQTSDLDLRTNQVYNNSTNRWNDLF